MASRDFRDRIRAAIQAEPAPDYADLDAEFTKELDALAEAGVVRWPDDRLTGRPLEARVRGLLVEMGLTVRNGRPALEDFVVEPPAGWLGLPWVIEVKSGKKSGPGRDDLRQLDDWVFELSGEELARREGLGSGVDWATMTRLRNPRLHHPSPHKGVLIYNGPLGQPLALRPRHWIGADELAFAERRDFCLIAFATLLAWRDFVVGSGGERLLAFWVGVQTGAGVLGPPESTPA